VSIGPRTAVFKAWGVVFEARTVVFGTRKRGIWSKKAWYLEQEMEDNELN